MKGNHRGNNTGRQGETNMHKRGKHIRKNTGDTERTQEGEESKHKTQATEP